MGLASCLVMQHLIISSQLKMQELKKMAVIDMIYGISAVITLVAGLSLLLYVGKGTEFYMSNYIFHIKLTLFILVVLLSIYPTVFFIKSKKKKQELTQVPKVIIMLIRMQLALVFIMPFLGALIARGQM